MWFANAIVTVLAQESGDEISEEVRLGFLSEGAFFGEAPVLGSFRDSAVSLRTVNLAAASLLSGLHVLCCIDISDRLTFTFGAHLLLSVLCVCSGPCAR